MVVVQLLFVLVFMHLYDFGAAKFDIPHKIMQELKKVEHEFNILKIEDARKIFFNTLYVINVRLKKKKAPKNDKDVRACYVIFHIDRNVKETKDPYVVYKHCLSISKKPK